MNESVDYTLHRRQQLLADSRHHRLRRSSSPKDEEHARKRLSNVRRYLKEARAFKGKSARACIAELEKMVAEGDAGFELYEQRAEILTAAEERTLEAYKAVDTAHAVHGHGSRDPAEALAAANAVVIAESAVRVCERELREAQRGGVRPEVVIPHSLHEAEQQTVELVRKYEAHGANVNPTDRRTANDAAHIALAQGRIATDEIAFWWPFFEERALAALSGRQKDEVAYLFDLRRKRTKGAWE